MLINLQSVHRQSADKAPTTYAPYKSTRNPRNLADLSGRHGPVLDVRQPGNALLAGDRRHDRTHKFLCGRFPLAGLSSGKPIAVCRSLSPVYNSVCPSSHGRHQISVLCCLSAFMEALKRGGTATATPLCDLSPGALLVTYPRASRHCNVMGSKAVESRVMQTLEFFLFGHPQIFVDGKEVTNFNTRKDRALLTYLAVTGRAHSREHLAGLLWSDLPDDKAMRNLRHTLSHLRKVLDSTWIRAEQSISLSCNLPWQTDVQTLRSAVGDFIKLSTDQIDQQRVDALYTGLNLYHGEFLQGFYVQKASLFEEWVVALREETRLLALRGWELIAQYNLDHGLYQQGLAASRRLLQLEAWSEVGHRLLMDLLARSGQRAAALHHYEQYRQLLADELGITPTPEIADFYARIQEVTVNKVHVAGAVVAPLKPVAAIASIDEPIPSQTVVPHNLLTPLAPFIGRANELIWICERLTTLTCRLLTIIGPGGMGKSSLALIVGRKLLNAQNAAFPDGIFFVPLAEASSVDAAEREQPLADASATEEKILRAIAEQVGCNLEAEISSTVHLQKYLSARRLLLIIDNMEHLLAGTGAIVTLLTHAPQVKVLVTSRTRLNVRGETVLTLDKLSLPTATYQRTVKAIQTNSGHVIDDEVWQTSEAVTMFVQRAQQQDPAFTVNAETLMPVGQICQLVEGLPLGIELAASMLPIVDCTALAAALAESLDFLVADTRDLPSTQRTLAAVFEHSWRLLQPQEQRLLVKLAIFSGTFQYEAAAEIVGATSLGLKQLINQSLISRVRDNRYTMHRTVYAFADQKLQEWPQQHEALQVQFVHFYLAFLARQEETLMTATGVIDIKSVHAELEHILNAWRWALQHQIIPPLNHALYAIFLFYEQNGFYLEVIDLCQQTLRAFSPLVEAQNSQVAAEVTLLLGRLQTFLGLWYLRLGKWAEAQAALASSWSILATAEDPAAAALCLIVRGHALSGHDVHQAKACLGEAQRLAQTSNVAWIRALAYQAFGEVNLLCGNYAEAEAQITEGLLIAREIHSARAITSGHKALGRLHLARGRYQWAEEHLRTSIEFAHKYQFRYLCLEGMIMLGEALRHQGRFAEAKVTFGESRQIAEMLGAGLLLAPILWEEGSMAEQCDEFDTAKVRFTESLAIGLPNWWIHALPTLGWVLLRLGEEVEAQIYFQKVWADAEAKGRLPIALDAQAGLAYLAVHQASSGPKSSQTIEQFGTVLRMVAQHPAVTEETHTRVTKLAAALDIPLQDANKVGATLEMGLLGDNGSS